MIVTGVLELRAGADLWFEGDCWRVVELVGTEVVLQRGPTLRRLAASALVGQARLLHSEDGLNAVEDEQADLPAVVLACLSDRQRADLEERVRHVREVLTDTGARDFTSRCQLKAAELGVTSRTLERWVSGYRRAGLAGLVDSRLVRLATPGVDPRWDAACRVVLDELVTASTPTVGAVIGRTSRRVESEHGAGVVPHPSRATAYRRVTALSKGRHAFGSGKARRSVANGPGGVYGRLTATRPAEYVVLDTNSLDVFAMEPVTLRWVKVELTVAMDLYSRCVTGLRLRPVAARSSDAASVLYQSVTPQTWGRHPGATQGPYVGVPQTLLRGDIDGGSHGGSDDEFKSGAEAEGESSSWLQPDRSPGLVPDTVVVDHGKIYLSEHVLGVCARLGISVQPAIPHKPTDKPTLERFFRTLRQQLLQHLPGYKGPDIYSRGKDVEAQSFYYVSELEQIIREWVGQVYHHAPHRGLVIPQQPGVALSPAQMFEAGIAQSGCVRLPARADLAYDFLQVAWRTIQTYGVEVDGRRYNGPGLNLHRNTRSPYGGRHAGKWPLMLDPDDVRFVFFQDPDDRTWHRLDWEHAANINAPFSGDAAAYARRFSLRAHQHVDPDTAVQQLLADWSKDLVTDRRDRSLARRLSAQRGQPDAACEPGFARPDFPGTSDRDAARDAVSLPGVIDLLQARENKVAAFQAVDDLDGLEVFARDWAAHPETGAYEVFDE